MIRNLLRDAVKKGNIEWQRHVLERMLERGISRETVKEVLLNGEIIENYYWKLILDGEGFSVHMLPHFLIAPLYYYYL